MTEKARSSRSSSSEKLLVGRIGRAVGLRGEVEVLVVSDHPERFALGSKLNSGELTVRAMRQQGERTIVAFEEVTDRTTAEALKGTELLVAADQARVLEGGEYWDHDLIGCEVVGLDGDRIGVVSDVLHQPANEVLVVDTEGSQALIPLVKAIVKAVDPGLRITIDPLPGLLD